MQLKHKNAGIYKVAIERFPDRVNVNIHASRPGLLIGKGLGYRDSERRVAEDLLKNVYININEVKKPKKREDYRRTGGVEDSGTFPLPACGQAGHRRRDPRWCPRHKGCDFGKIKRCGNLQG